MSNSLQHTYVNKDFDFIDKKLSSFVVRYYIIEILNLLIKLVFPITEVVWSFISYGFIILLFLMMLSTIKYVIKRSLLPFVLTEIIFLILFMLSLLQGNAISSLLFSTAFRTLGVSIPIAFYVYSIKDKKILYDYMVKASYFMIFILILIVLINIISGKRDDTYNMSLSYAIVLPALFQTNEFFTKKRISSLITLLISLSVIVIYGARGPLLCVAIMFLYKFLLEYNIVIKFILFIFGGSLLSLFVIFSKQIGELILDAFSGLGIYSRTIIMLVNGTLLSSSGREELLGYYIDLIELKPIFGWGLMGGWIKAGSGPHNMLIEFLLALGILVGGILCVLAISFIFKPFFVKNKVEKELIIIYSSVNIVLFLVSGNFLEKVNWFVFVILCISSNKNINGHEEKATVS